MKTKDLLELVKQGAKPIVKIVDKYGVLEGPDTGMIGRILKVGESDFSMRENQLVSFVVDFYEFTEYNKSHAVPNFYDENMNPCLTWMETKSYERDSKSYVIYENLTDDYEYSDIQFLEIFDEKNKWLNAYIKSGSNMSYVEWLETSLDLIQMM